MYLEILVPCFFVASLVGGLHWWARSVAYSNKKQAMVYEHEGSFFKGGRW